MCGKKSCGSCGNCGDEENLKNHDESEVIEEEIVETPGDKKEYQVESETGDGTVIELPGGITIRIGKMRDEVTSAPLYQSGDIVKYENKKRYVFGVSKSFFDNNQYLYKIGNKSKRNILIVPESDISPFTPSNST
jgi:hypothetical protein